MSKLNKNFLNKTKKRGFTLIELLVVIAIIGLLSTLAVIALNNARQKSRDAKRVSDVKQLQSALELYYNDANGYPPTADIEGVCLSHDSGVGGGFASPCETGGTTFMNIVPSNPSPGGTTYVYDIDGDKSTYELTYTLESGAGGLGDGIHTASEQGITKNTAGQ